MADIRFTLIDRNGDYHPGGIVPWENPTIVLERSDEGHGMFFDYGIDQLVFTGDPADIIYDEYEEYGLNGIMTVVVEYQCSETGHFEELIRSPIDFGTYKRKCGIECNVTVSLESSTDVMSFLNNYEQKVDLLKDVAIDGITPLDSYDGLNFEMDLPARELRERLEGTAKPGPFTIFPINVTATGLFVTTSVRPSYINNQVSELQTGDLIGASQYRVNPQNAPALHPFNLSPVLDLTQSPGCTAGLVNYKFRMKGHVTETGSSNRSVHLQLVFFKGDYNDSTDPAIQKVSISPTQTYFGADGPDLDFDETFTGMVPLEPGEQLRIILFSVVVFNAAGRTTNLYVTWDEETSVEIYANTVCPPSPSKMFLINETISRVSESITKGRLKFFSDMFGRTDSQPYTRPVDSCAGLFGVTSGLNIRRRMLPDGNQPGFFKNMKELFEDLNSIWNIGWTIEKDTNRPGFNRLRLEDWRFFYQNQIGLTFPNPVSVEKNVDLTRAYSQLLCGFDKWEAQKYTGLDEFMTQRTYRVDLNSINNVLDRVCNMILSTYCIEETRRLRDNTQDWTYDNDTFGFVFKRGDGPLNVKVEMMSEVGQQVENVLNPGSCYNMRVSPARNAMRWFNFIMQSLKVLTHDDKLFFAEGKGNYTAAYKLTSCFIEGSQLDENGDIDINKFATAEDARPITFAETDTFEHPLSFNMFKRLKNEPDLMFKSIIYPCNGVFREGWIKKITYELTEGMATIVTYPKNTLQIPTPIPPCEAFVINLVHSSCGPGCAQFTWDDATADSWQWQLENLTNPGATQSGVSNTTSVQFDSLEEGDYNFTVQGYCGDSPGQNIAEVAFTAVPPDYKIQLSAYKFYAQNIQEWKWKVVAEPVGGGSFMQPCEFFFKRCSFFDGEIQCNSPALGEWGEIQCVVGASSTTGDTWGAETQDSTLLEIKIRLASLSGMTPDQIIMKPGETWNLIFE